MARFEFRLPDIGEGVVEGEIVAWGEGVEPGAIVKEDQVLAEVMTDKATVTIPSPVAGKVLELAGSVGDVVEVGAVLLVIQSDLQESTGADPQPAEQASGSSAQPTVAAAAESTKADHSDQGPAATAAGSIPEQLPGMNFSQDKSAQPTGLTRPLASPATRQLARQQGIDLSRVPPTGPHGRTTRDDVVRFNDARQAQQRPDQMEPSTQALQKVTSSDPTPSSVSRDSREERTPLRGVRRRIFEHMAHSKHTAAHFTFVEECDVTQLEQVRGRLAPLAEGQGVKLAFLPFIVKACVLALKKHPSLNASFDDETQEIVRKRYYDIGIATATDAGLMVPVIRDADSKSLLEIARDIQRLGAQAREGTLSREDMGNASFTVTSLGKLGGLFATPVLNYPEVGILGIHRIKERPVVRDGRIVIGKVMLLSLSFDHRLIDGHVGAAFAYEVIGALESMDRLMLEMG